MEKTWTENALDKIYAIETASIAIEVLHFLFSPIRFQSLSKPFQANLFLFNSRSKIGLRLI